MNNSEQPAYPLKEPLSDDTLRLTKREYFAGLAMQGIIAAHNIYITGIDNEVNARIAVNAADALLKQLENQS